MKSIITILSAIFILSILLFTWSGNLTNQLVDIVGPTLNAKKFFVANVQLQRALNSTSLGITLKEEKFFDDALRFLTIAEKQIETTKTDERELLEQNLIDLDKIRLSIQSTKTNIAQNAKITKKEFLNISYQVDQLGQQLSKDSKTHWGKNIENFDQLVVSFEYTNRAIRLFQFLSILIFFYLLYSLYKKRQAQRAVEEKEKLHSLLFSSLSESVFLCDRDGYIQSCNFSCSIITGLSPQELIGMDLTSFFPYEAFQDEKLAIRYHIRTLKQLLAKGEAFNNLVMSSQINNEERWYSLNIQPIIQNASKGSFSSIVSINDITEGMQAERIIKKQQVQLVESSRLQSIGEMASGIAHEINNPLSIISMTTERLARKATRRGSLDSQDITKTTDKVLNTLNRMAKVVKSLLGLSRNEGNEFKEIEIDLLMKLSLDFCYTFLAQNDVELRTQDSYEDLQVECNTTQISQVLINLIKNANDAIEDHKDKWIQINVIDKNHLIRFEVIDCGNGIPQEVQEKMLMPFFTTKEIGKGTGLGLSISRKILEAHNSELQIDNDHKNTCFFFELPKKQVQRKLEDNSKA